MRHKVGECLKLRFREFLTLVLSLILACIGCAASTKINKPPETANIKKVAVLYFYNISSKRDAGKIVANLFVTELFKSGRFSVEEPGNIIQFFTQERIDSVGEIEIDKVKLLGRRLGVDAVILGTVEEFSDGGGWASSVPVVSITARMIETSKGKLIWSAQNKGRGDDYVIVFNVGEVRSINALAQKVIKEMIRTIK